MSFSERDEIDEDILGLLPKEAFLVPPPPIASSLLQTRAIPVLSDAPNTSSLSSGSDNTSQSAHSPTDRDYLVDLVLNHVSDPADVAAIFAALDDGQDTSTSTTPPPQATSNSTTSSPPFSSPSPCASECWGPDYAPCPPCDEIHNDLPYDLDPKDLDIHNAEPGPSSAVVHGIKSIDNQVNIGILTNLHGGVDRTVAERETREARRARKRARYEERRRKLQAENDKFFQSQSIQQLRQLPAPISDAPAQAEVKPVEGKGLGVVASDTIKKGEVIVSEAPFLVVDHPPIAQQIVDRLDRSSTESQELFFSFTPADEFESLDYWDDERLASIVNRNVIPIGRDDEGDTGHAALDMPQSSQGSGTPCGLFRLVCRVNHSCLPNAQWTWRPTAGRIELKAMVNIAAGEEITACYLQEPLLPHASRRSILRGTWSFACTCPRCSVPLDERREADARLEICRQIKNSFIGIENEDTWRVVDSKQCAIEIETLISHLQEKGLVGELSECYFALWALNVRWGKGEEAKQAGRRWLAHNDAMQEPVDEFTRQTVENPQTILAWRAFLKDEPESDTESEDEDDEYSHGHCKKQRSWTHAGRYLSGERGRERSVAVMTRSRTISNMTIEHPPVTSSSKDGMAS